MDQWLSTGLNVIMMKWANICNELRAVPPPKKAVHAPQCLLTCWICEQMSARFSCVDDEIPHMSDED